MLERIRAASRLSVVEGGEGGHTRASVSLSTSISHSLSPLLDDSRVIYQA